MVSLATDAAVWEDLEDIGPPMYNRNPLNLDPFKKKLDNRGTTVSVNMDPAVAGKCVFKLFPWRLLGEL